MLILSLLLVALGIALFPCWPYSALWGHGPSAAVGVMLVFMAVLAAGGKSTPGDTVGERLNQPRRIGVQRADIGVVPPTAESTRLEWRLYASGENRAD